MSKAEKGELCDKVIEVVDNVLLPTHVTSEVNLIIEINHHHNLVVVGNGK